MNDQSLNIELLAKKKILFTISSSAFNYIFLTPLNLNMTNIIIL